MVSNLRLTLSAGLRAVLQNPKTGEKCAARIVAQFLLTICFVRWADDLPFAWLPSVTMLSTRCKNLLFRFPLRRARHRKLKP